MNDRLTARQTDSLALLSMDGLTEITSLHLGSHALFLRAHSALTPPLVRSTLTTNASLLPVGLVRSLFVLHLHRQGVRMVADRNCCSVPGGGLRARGERQEHGR